MNEREFVRYIIAYVEDDFNYNQIRYNKILLKWLWDEFIFEIQDERIKNIKNFSDFVEFEEIDESRRITIGLINKTQYKNLEYQIGKYYTKSFNLDSFLNTLRIRHKLTENTLNLFLKFKFFSTFLSSVEIIEEDIVDFTELLLKIIYEKLFYSDYKDIINFTDLTKILFLLLNIKPNLDEISISFFIVYVKELLEEKNLVNYAELFINIIQKELVEEFFLVLIYLINLMELNYTNIIISQDFEKKLETEELNQLLFLRDNLEELLKLSEDFIVLISNSKSIIVIRRIEEIFKILKKSINFDMDSNFEKKFSLEYYKQQISRLMKMEETIDLSHEINTNIKNNKYHVEFVEFYNFIITTKKLNQLITQFSEKDNSYEIILEIFESINNFEERYSNLLNLNINKVIEDKGSFKLFYNQIREKIKNFFEIVNEIQLAEHFIDESFSKVKSICVLEFDKGNYKIFNLIRNYLTYKYPYVENNIKFSPNSIDIELVDFSKVNITKENLIFKIQELNNIPIRKIILIVEKETNIDYLKNNFLEPVFNKIIELFNKLVILIRKNNPESNDLNYLLIYQIDKEEDLRLTNIRIKDYAPKKIFTKKMETINVRFRNPNKWPIYLSELIIFLNNQEIKKLRNINISSFQEYNISFKIFHREPGSYPIIFNIKFGVKEGETVIIEKSLSLSIPFLVEEPPIEIQKKRAQDSYFDKFG